MKIAVVDTTNGKVICGIFIQKYVKMTKIGGQKAPIDDNLVPNEGFTEESKSDGTNNFSCKQCDRTFVTEKSVKQHMAAAHKNKNKGIKRTATKEKESKTDEEEAGETPNVEDKRTKTAVDDEFVFGPAVSDTQQSADISVHDVSVMNSTLQICAQTLGNKLNSNKFVGFDDDVEKIVNGEDIDDDDDILPPDQDHSDMLDTTEHVKDPEDDVPMLKAKIISLKMDLSSKERLIVEKESEAENAFLEVSALTAEVSKLRSEIAMKDETIENNLATINSLEETKTMYETKLRTYGDTIKVLSKTIKEKRSEPNKASPTNNDEILKLRHTCKEKTTKLNQSVKAQKELADKLAELEIRLSGDTSNLDTKRK